LLAHCIDTALWLNGSIDTVSAMTETFVKQRKHAATGKVSKVLIDDASAQVVATARERLTDPLLDASFQAARPARPRVAELG
jgi:myo-inositol 2-dehydrogenase/D-chiro-inositol 1-dehydrogenase